MVTPSSTSCASLYSEVLSRQSESRDWLLWSDWLTNVEAALACSMIYSHTAALLFKRHDHDPRILPGGGGTNSIGGTAYIGKLEGYDNEEAGLVSSERDPDTLTSLLGSSGIICLASSAGEGEVKCSWPLSQFPRLRCDLKCHNRVITIVLACNGTSFSFCGHAVRHEAAFSQFRKRLFLLCNRRGLE